jgi:hypothetical protein
MDDALSSSHYDPTFDPATVLWRLGKTDSTGNFYDASDADKRFVVGSLIDTGWFSMRSMYCSNRGGPAEILQFGEIQMNSPRSHERSFVFERFLNAGRTSAQISANSPEPIRDMNMAFWENPVYVGTGAAGFVPLKSATGSIKLTLCCACPISNFFGWQESNHSTDTFKQYWLTYPDDYYRARRIMSIFCRDTQYETVTFSHTYDSSTDAWSASGSGPWDKDSEAMPWHSQPGIFW